MFVGIKQEKPFISVEGRKRRISTGFYNVLCVLTLGGFHMVCRYLPKVKHFLLSSPCSLSDADCVIVTSQNGRREFVDVLAYSTEEIPSLRRYSLEGKARVVDSLFSRLIYDVVSRRFVVPPEQKAVFRDFEELYSTEISKSPETERAEAIQRNIFYGRNVTSLPIPGVFDIVVKNTLNITFLSNIICLFVWRAVDYHNYAFVMGMLMLYSFVFTNWEEISHSIGMKKLVKRRTVKILRGGRFVEVDSREVYPGNIIYIEPCKEFPCDALVIRGDAITNECLLTGETVPIYKNADQLSVVYSGTDVLKSISTIPMSTNLRNENLCRVRSLTSKNRSRAAGMVGSIDVLGNSAVGMVLRTGFQTTRGQILKNMLNAKPVHNRFIREAEIIILGIVMVAMAVGIGMAYVLNKMGFDASTNLMYSLDLFFTFANPAIPTYLRVGTQLCYKKLIKKNIYCSNLNKIHLAGRIDTAVFDKTGTLTCEGLDLLCIDDLNRPVDDINKVAMVTRLGLSTCHLVYELDGRYSGDTLDLKMFIFSSSKLVQHENTRSVVIGGHNRIYGPILKEYNDSEEMVYYQKDRTHGGRFADIDGNADEEDKDLSPVLLDVDEGAKFNLSDECGEGQDGEINAVIMKTYEFDSNIRRMSVVVDDGDRKYVFTKGSPESIQEILKERPRGYEEKAKEYSLGGYRVISLAYKEISESADRASDESEMKFLALIVFSNKLKENSRRTVDELNKANIRNIMCTGDNILTAISVGKECRIVEEFVPVIFPVLEENAKSIFDVDWLCVGDEEEFTFDKVRLSLYRGNDRVSNNEFVVACEGREFDFFRNTHYFEFILEKGAIFARFNPGQKKALIENLRASGKITMFCGDGANDSGALSSADVGLALGQNEASLAANFTSSEISSVLDLIKEGRSAFVTSTATFKYVVSYCAIAYVVLVFLVLRKKFLSDLQTIHGDLLVSIPIAYMLTCFDASDKLFPSPPDTFLLPKKDFVPFCLTIALECLVLWILSLYGEPCPEISTQSITAELMFFVSTFIYIFNALYLSDCSPHRQSLKDNVLFKTFISFMILSTIAFLMVVYLFPEWTFLWLRGYNFVETDGFEIGLVLISAFSVTIAVFVVQPLVGRMLGDKSMQDMVPSKPEEKI
ncbi:CATION-TRANSPORTING ATPase [Encephalitozoon cuniculi GB-M1]|uniref:Cation-transporting ATPase n=2 Tax=Encephalitozoon cuniculi TaxID=6035 RepID=Q8SRH4_ENCCU|nr:type V P-ATPase [Encephalitozoon cuniculi GB-M1]KMV65874.1 type V P-ATPase [Encephalitozoon cuniculi EcunIII-L]UYI27313.1 trans-membrane ATPase transporter [Encephalitozoon cuniculi]CAD25682.2 CATION-TRANSPORTING ATPase [Encephalitozoon cuniculi GB-M1]